MRKVTLIVLVSLILVAAAAALAGDALDSRPGPVAPGEYAGVKTCRKCHFKNYKSWKGNKHAKAFDVLPEQYRSNEVCLGCHTTGHGQPGGFVSKADTKALVGVQCEMCHGPGAKHAAYAKENEERKDDPAVVAELKSLAGAGSGQSACWKCHLDQTHGKHPEFEK